MGHIFISYSHKDTDYAHKLADSLQAKGFEVWIDARLDYGSQWPVEIERHLDACSAFILIMTPRAFASEWVQSELQRAKRRFKPIFPLLLEGNEPWLTVESTQYYDVRDGQMPDARFYGALGKLPTVSQTAETYVRLPKSVVNRELTRDLPKEQARPEPRIRTEIWVAIIGAVATLCAACLTIGVPFALPYFNSRSSPTEPQVIYITATDSYQDAATDVPIEFTTESTATSIPPTFTPAPPPYIPPPPTAEPVIVTKEYYISNCCNNSGQRAAVIDYSVNVNTVGVLKVEFIPEMSSSCSDIYMHILWDGEEIRQTGALGPISGIGSTGLLNLSSSISPGRHTLTLSPEGIYGGCNSGTLGGWAGNLSVQTSKYP